jgi:hypothetical protein
MLNKDVNVPDNTIAVFIEDIDSGFKYEDIDSIFSVSDKKRDWFDPHFYRCLPLAIANQYGFVLKSQFDFAVNWDGGSSPDSVRFFFNESLEEVNKKFPKIGTHFGFGTFTVITPFSLRTPPGINLMTIGTPNNILSNITVMSGVVETDNLRRNFTFNFRINHPNMTVHVPKGYPLATVIPIPRYFVENFKLQNAEDIFSDEIVTQEFQAYHDALYKREELSKESIKNRADRDYFNGRDVYGNYFSDHQMTNLKKSTGKD